MDVDVALRWSTQLIRYLSTRDAMTVVEGRGPTMIRAGTRLLDAWPDGTVDLRGLPW